VAFPPSFSFLGSGIGTRLFPLDFALMVLAVGKSCLLSNVERATVVTNMTLEHARVGEPAGVSNVGCWYHSRALAFK
jgi:hypothetical protein